MLKLTGRGIKPSNSSPDALPYQSQCVFSTPEMTLYWRLQGALPDWVVLAQVSLSRLLRVRPGYDNAAWFGAISRMTVDFVVCTRDGFPMAVIELDDGWHSSDAARKADDRKAAALKSAGIKLIRYDVRSIPMAAKLKADILEGWVDPGEEVAGRRAKRGLLSW